MRDAVNGSKKTIVGVIAVILVVIIVGYTYKPVVDPPTLNVVKTSKLMTWAGAKAKCDRGLPSTIKQINATAFNYTCEAVPLNKTSCVAIAIVGSSLTLMVGNYDPDLVMLFATFILLAFQIVTPAQGTHGS